MKNSFGIMRATRMKDAIEAIKEGDKIRGRKIMAQILSDNPKNEDAWLWLSRAVEDEEQQQECLERVVKINPRNEIAYRRLSELQGTKWEISHSSQKKGSINILLVSSLILLLGVLIAIGIFVLNRTNKTENVTVDVSSVITWDILDNATVIEIGNKVQAKLKEDSHNVMLAIDQDSYNRHLYWANAELLNYAGYIKARLPLSIEDVGLLDLQDGVLVYEFVGPSDIETYAPETRYVWVEVDVTGQSPIEFRVNKYREETSLTEMKCFSCATYAFDHCTTLRECLWTNNK
jgi:hypothetical protein